MSNDPVIKSREREAVLRALGSGVPPTIGVQHLQVGRRFEIETILKDLDYAADQGASVRFITGSYGSGKTYLLNLLRELAMQRDFVVVHAELAVNRRLVGSTSGEARRLYSTLMANMATKGRPTGGALETVLQRYADGHPSDKALNTVLLRQSGTDFVKVVSKYIEGFCAGNDDLKQAALKWLRAEFGNKREATQALGVGFLIDDKTIYEHLKVLAAFVRCAGYKGLIVTIDEMDRLFRLPNKKARDLNYEKVLEIFNDCSGGRTTGITIYFGGVTKFLEDKQKGLASNEALATRLSTDQRIAGGVSGFYSPVMQLSNLTQEELLLLFKNIRNIFALGDPDKYLVPDEALYEFLKHCQKVLGASCHQTPRNAIKGFVQFLSGIEENSCTDWRQVLNSTPIAVMLQPDEEESEDSKVAGVSGTQMCNDDLATLTL